MITVENSFKLTARIGNKAEIKSFENSSVAHFSVAFDRTEKKGEVEKKHTVWLPVCLWRKNDDTGDFALLDKGTLVTLSGYFKPESWTDEHQQPRSRLLLVATEVYLPREKEENPVEAVVPAEESPTQKTKTAKTKK